MSGTQGLLGHSKPFKRDLLVLFGVKRGGGGGGGWVNDGFSKANMQWINYN